MRWSCLVLAALMSCASGSEPASSAADAAAPSSADAASAACTGQPNGTPCGDPATGPCDRADICVDGTCVANFAAAGTSCGDQRESDCTAADTCDGEGRCVANHAAAGAPCGDPTDEACTAPDTCDGDGTCQRNHAPADTPCGDDLASACTAPDACDGNGACLPHDAADGTGCDDCADGPGWCASCDQGVCPDLCDAPAALSSGFAGGNGLGGVMFDVVAQRDVRITGFDTNLSGAEDHNVLVYTKVGTYAGFEQDAAAWTLLGASSVTSAGSDVATPLPIPIEVEVLAGERAAFYLSTMGTSLRYSNSTEDSPGALLVGDDALDVFEGSGNQSGFGTFFAPRRFNGTVHYRVCEE